MGNELKKVLVIDDDPVFLEVLKIALTTVHFQPFVASSGREGLDLAHEVCPDLVICDIAMEEMDGYQVLERFQSDRELRLVPFLFISGFATDQDRRRGMGMGANDFISKPFKLEDLYASIEAQLRKRETVRNHFGAQLADLHNISMERDSFLNLISHRIRSSYSGILGAIRLLQDELKEMDDAEVQEILEMVREDIRSNLQLSDNLVTWTRKQTTTMKTGFESLPLFGVAENALVQLQNLAVGKSIRMINHVPRLAKVVGSEKDLHEVFRQLLMNAIKHSNANSLIEISAIQKDNYYQVTVSDQGQGMSQEKLAALFDYTSNKKTSESRQGFGLQFVYDMIHGHDGRIWIKSQPGKGTEVYFTLPEPMDNET